MLVARVVHLLDPGHTLTLRNGDSHAGPGEGFLHQLPLCDESRAESASIARMAGPSGTVTFLLVI